MDGSDSLNVRGLRGLREHFQPVGVNGCQEALFSGCEGAVLVFGL